VIRAITAAGGRGRFVAADLTDLDSLRRLADQAGAVDILVNNAAAGGVRGGAGGRAGKSGDPGRSGPGRRPAAGRGDPAELATWVRAIRSMPSVLAGSTAWVERRERTVGEFAARRRGKPAGDLVAVAIGRCTVAAYRAALEDWVARPGPDLAARLSVPCALDD
jgi:hypothetical protein